MPRNKSSLLTVLLALLPLPLLAQAPLARPLAELDRLKAQLTSADVVGEPIPAGDVTVIPFAAIRFGVGAAGTPAGVGGGVGGSVVPLGVLIVHGDDVRLEPIPELPGQARSLVRELVQAVLDRRVVFMGNGLNIGNAPGTVAELEPLIAAQMGQATIIGNALNLGSMTPPVRPATSTPDAALRELTRLFDARKYADALSLADGLLAKDPQNADLEAWKTRILRGMTSDTAPPKPR